MMNFKVGEFEGPLDLLLHLVRAEEFEIEALRLLGIVEQFVSAVSNSELSEISDFVLMAAHLIAIKARYLNKGKLEFDSDRGDGDPLEELVEKLRVYKRVKELGEYLRRRENIGYSFARAPETAAEDDGALSLSTGLLYKAFERVIDNLSRFDEERQAFFRLKRRSFVSVAEKRRYILEILSTTERVALSSVCSERSDVIACFLALLELLRAGKIAVAQGGVFDEIYIQRSA